MTNNILLGTFKAILCIENNCRQHNQEEPNLEIKTKEHVVLLHVCGNSLFVSFFKSLWFS